MGNKHSSKKKVSVFLLVRYVIHCTFLRGGAWLQIFIWMADEWIFVRHPGASQVKTPSLTYCQDLEAEESVTTHVAATNKV